MAGNATTARAVVCWIALALTLALGAVATAMAASTAFATGVPPASRVDLRFGVANPAWALPILSRIELGCRLPATLAQTPCDSETATALASVHRAAAIAGGATFAIAFVFFVAALSSASRRPPAPAPGAFQLRIGRATGLLSRLGHRAGICAGSQIVLSGDDCCQNFMVLGAIGTGKTTRVINPLVRQAFEQDCGMLIFSVKGDYGATARRLAARVGASLATIGPGNLRCNLLAGLTPAVAASFLKSAVYLSMGRNDAAAVYVETATNFAGNALGVLSFWPRRYTLTGLRDVVDDAKKLEGLIEETRAIITPDQEPLLEAYTYYLTKQFPKFEPKIKSGARTTLSVILDCFKLPEIRDAFCNTDADSLSMHEVLDGQRFLLELPLAEYGLSAGTIYTMIRLRLFNVGQRRASEPTWNQTRPVVFVCDEFQDVVAVASDALSDLTFWDKSRSVRFIGIVAAQGYSSFIAKIRDETLTDALLQNFRQKICFRTEDWATIERFVDLAGKTDRSRSIRSRSRGYTSGGYSVSSATQQRASAESVLDAQTFRADLGKGRALAMLSILGDAYDDVLELPSDYGL